MILRIARVEDGLGLAGSGDATPASSHPRRGAVLIVVMIVIAVLSLVAYQFVDMTMAEYKGSVQAVKTAQARAAAESGIHYVAALLATEDNITNYLSGNIFSNEDRFRDVPVPGIDGARFRVIAADPDAPGGFRYGVIDECAKINLNTMFLLTSSQNVVMQMQGGMQMQMTMSVGNGKALHDMLVKLPRSDESITNAILDWRDEDSSPRSGGSEDYSGQGPGGRGYRPKNRSLDTIEELLLVSGVTPDLLFGSDDQAGWSTFLTTFSRELNADSSGKKRGNINDGSDGKDAQVFSALYDSLGQHVSEDLANYIALYRVYGGASTDTSGATKTSGKGGGDKGGDSTPAPVEGKLQGLSLEGILNSQDPKNKKTPSKTLGSLFDLINTKVTIPSSKPKEPAIYFLSPLNKPEVQRDLLPKLFDKFSISTEDELPARINVNTAPREVLATLPGLADGDVETILRTRPSSSEGNAASTAFQSPAWLFTETQGRIKLDTLKKLEKYVTTRSQVYRIQVIGTVGDNGPSVRLEAVIDTNAGRPRIIYWRDLPEAGIGSFSGQ